MPKKNIPAYLDFSQMTSPKKSHFKWIKKVDSIPDVVEVGIFKIKEEQEKRSASVTSTDKRKKMSTIRLKTHPRSDEHQQKNRLIEDKRRLLTEMETLRRVIHTLKAENDALKKENKATEQVKTNWIADYDLLRKVNEDQFNQLVALDSVWRY